MFLHQLAADIDKLGSLHTGGLFAGVGAGHEAGVALIGLISRSV